MKYDHANIVFFDGVCNLCNSWVNWLLERDANNVMYFAPLQGVTASALIPDSTKSLDTVVYYRKGQIYVRSNAVIWMLKDIDKFAVMIALSRLVPRSLSDIVYRLVAKHRYYFFGRRDLCRLPNPAEKPRFLD